MIKLLTAMCDLYHYINVEIADPRTKDYYLTSTLPIFSILILYHCFVRSIGPKLMQNREAFNLKTVILYYNVIQILACIYIFWKGTSIIFGWNRRYSFLCEPVEWEETPYGQEIFFIHFLRFGTKRAILRGNSTIIKMIWLIWVYTVTKLADLLDTVFFVLRKKNSKVSFLHLYHHTGMVLLTWGCLKWLPGGHDIILGYINAVVHAFMYTYYTLALLGSKKCNWMKKYITQMQMVQFFINIIHSSIILIQPNCTYPKWTTLVIIPQNTFMLFLFFDFYRKEYMKKKSDDNKNHHRVE